jgi:transposase
VAKSYRPVQRDQQFLMAPDMREWLPEDHLVWLVLDVIDRIDTSGFHRRRARRGTSNSTAGQRGYDPDMLLAVLVYAYCVGERSSRQIERRCVSDVAFRVACAGDGPDHTVIARFRSEFADAFSNLFAEILTICAQAGMVRVGSVAIDGTKIAANASIDRSKRESTLRQMAARIVEEATQLDAADEGLDDRVGPGMADPAARAAAIDAALAQIAKERRERPDPGLTATIRRVERARRQVVETTASVTASYERQQAARTAGTPLRGRRAVGPEQHKGLIKLRANLARAEQALADRIAAQPDRKANLTDPDSRIMKDRYRFVQAYNAQLVVSDDHVIIAAVLSNQVIDTGLYQPMVAAAVDAVAALPATSTGPRQIGTVLADAGYFSSSNLTCAGPDRLIAPGKAAQITDPPRPRAKNPDARRDADAITAMRHQFADPDHQNRYRRRAATVEPVNAHLKDRRGLRRFAMRGLAKAHGELQLAAAATNLMRYATATATI